MNVVALFLKAPVLGMVKTRLAKTLGDEAALMAYTDLVEFLLKQVRVNRIHIHYTPKDPEPMLRWLGDAYSYVAQVGSGLGERLIHAMELEFAAGADKLIFLGGDCPYVDQARLDDAFAALDDHDVVMGPATDGGYYLIGMKHILPELFTDVPWGTEAVFQRSVEICGQNGYSYALLPEESDVDDFEGWEKARAYLEGE
jgi:rSAM/selenodomain-associated transferase 1